MMSYVVVHQDHDIILCCSKKTLKLKQSVPPPKTPDPVDGRRHIELQVVRVTHL